ncbi:MAG: serine/threonine-protein kinase [Planctomycetota bacterium]
MGDTLRQAVASVIDRLDDQAEGGRLPSLPPRLLAALARLREEASDAAAARVVLDALGAEERPLVERWHEQLARDQALLPERFRLLGPIKEGGQGIVYDAEETLPLGGGPSGAPAPKRRVALKVPRMADRRSPACRRRFRREVDCLVKLNHPGIVTVFDAGELRQQEQTSRGAAERGAALFFTMEVVGGRLATLADLIEAERPSEELLELLADASEAVAHLHERGLIHGDIKPENVLVTSEGRPLLADFGSVSERGAQDSPPRTEAYSRPRAPGERPSESWDLYALCVSATQVLLRCSPHDTSRRFGELPPSLCKIVMTLTSGARASEHRARERPAKALARALRRYVRQEHAFVCAGPPLFVFAFGVLLSHAIINGVFLVHGESTRAATQLAVIVSVVIFLLAYGPMFWLASRLPADSLQMRPVERVAVSRWASLRNWIADAAGPLEIRIRPRQFCIGLWFGHAVSGLVVIVSSISAQPPPRDLRAMVNGSLDAYPVHFLLTGLALWAMGCLFARRFQLLGALWIVSAGLLQNLPQLHRWGPLLFGVSASLSCFAVLLGTRARLRRGTVSAPSQLPGGPGHVA